MKNTTNKRLNRTEIITIRIDKITKENARCAAALDRRTLSGYIEGLVVKDVAANSAQIEAFKKIRPE